MKKEIDSSNPEDTKLCPYCMGELNIDATKCSHCGEILKEGEKKERLKREGKDTAKGEVRKQLQDRLKSDKTAKTTQKSMAKSEGVKSWWVGQSIVVKAVVVLCVGMVAFSSTYIAGTYLGASNQITEPNSNQVDQVSGSSSNSGSSESVDNFISAAKAKSIADQYLASKGFIHDRAGTPSLKGSVYYVPIVTIDNKGQNQKGFVRGYVRVDARKGTVLGIETWDIETNETIQEPP